MTPTPRTAARPRRRLGASRMVLAGILVVFVVIACWNIGDAGFSGFYSSAARSMAGGGRAFWFGTFDPGATITLDKLSGFLVPQALSARVFGFHAWSIALPQVVEGCVTIVAVHLIAARWRGTAAGLAAAGAFAATPLMASMFGHVMEDGLLTMCLALAVLCFQSASRSGRLVPLLFAGGWVAVGFQAKMLQAWFVLPALLLGCLATTAWPWRRRMTRAALSLAVAVAGSLSWMLVVQAIPPASRPYVDGSTSNDVFSMVFGYNGLNRFVPGVVSGAAASFSPPNLQSSFDKLLLPAATTQVGWFYPLAVTGIVLGLLAIRRQVARGAPATPTPTPAPAPAPATATTRAPATTLAPAATPVVKPASAEPSAPVFVMVIVWLVVAAAVLSVASVPHTAYLAAVAVPLAVLAGVGAAELAGRMRAGDLGSSILVSSVVAAQTAWVVVILTTSGVAPFWLVPVVCIIGAAAVAGLVLRVLPRWSGVAAGCAILLAPAMWTASIVDPSLGGSANDAYGGPRTSEVPFFFQASGSVAERNSFREFSIAAPVLTSPDPGLTIEQRHLVRYLHREVGTSGTLLVTTSWGAAEPYILAAGLPVVSVGGFSGAIPSPTLGAVTSAVGAGDERFFLLPTRAHGDSGRGATERSRIEAWVGERCTLVPDDVYEEATTLPDQTLWDCRGA